VREGIAGRYFGLPDDILDEVRAGGFHILSHWVRPARTEDDCDDLIVAALE